MFDPAGPKERYIRLVNWRNGMWVNYWTQILPKVAESEHDGKECNNADQVAYNDIGLMELGIVAPSADIGLSSSIEIDWMRETGQLENHCCKNEQKLKDFIVLPTGLGRRFGGGENWEKVIIGGVDDEVAAHCGLFIQGQNLDYDGLLERVGRQILRWCAQL
jgi:hypothetical protein